MHIVKYTLIIFTSLLPTILEAQSNYVEGYIILSNKDTMRGFVDDRNDVRNSRIVRFKKSLKEKAQEFTPEAICGFSCLGYKYYFSNKVSLTDNAGVPYKKIVFTQKLVEGRLNLYYYKERDLTEHFYLQKDTTGLVELTNEENTINTEGKRYAVESKKYLKTLSAFTRDCPDKALKENDWRFDESEFEKIVIKYNHCGDSAQRIKNIRSMDKRHKTQVHITGVAGVNVSSMFSEGFLFNSTFDKKKTGFSGGIAFNINFYRMPKSISLQLDMNYSQKGVSSSSIDYTIRPGYLDIAALVKYTYPKGPVRPFLGVGPLYGMRASKKSSIDIFNGTLYPKSEGGYCIELGIWLPVSKTKTNGISLIGRFEESLLLVDTNKYYNYFNQSWQLKIGYCFR